MDPYPLQPVVALAEADREPDWAAARTFVEAMSDDDLLALLETPAELEVGEFGSGLEQLRRQLLDDLSAVRHGGAILVVRTRIARAYAACPGDAGAGGYRALDRLRWAGALAAAGLEVGERD